jgi:catecholate siderophore receptor
VANARNDRGRARRSGPRPARRFTTTAIVAVGVLGGAAPEPALASVPAPIRRLQPSDDPWLDRRLAELSALGAAVPDAVSPRAWTATTFPAPGDPRPQVQTADQDTGPRRYAIDAGPLADILAKYEAVSGVSVTAPSELIRQVNSPGVSGLFTAAEALERILADTSIRFRFTGPLSAVLEVRVAADTVDVTANAPRVASPRYAAPLVETPQTIQVIPRALIEEQGATTLSEAMRNVPGITMQAGEGGGASNTSGDMFNMRGFSTANSLFVDGVRDDGLMSRDVFNLEQIEVFSGPTGSDVGRTNAAGYINLSTKTPTLETLRGGTFAVGEGAGVRATLDVNQPLALGPQGSFLGGSAVRVNALWLDGGVSGRDHVERGSQSIAPSLSLGLGTPTRVAVSAQITRQDNLADYGLPSAASPVGTFTAAGILATTPVDQATYYGSPGYDYDKVRQDGVTLRAEHDFSPQYTLRNQARYNSTAREAVITSIANPAAYNPASNLVTLSRQANDRHNWIVSNQTSLIARPVTGALRHDLSLGLDITSEHQSAPGLTGVGTREPVDLNHPDVFNPVVGMNITPSGVVSDGRTNTVAVYAFDAFDLGPRLRVSGGVRADSYDTTSHSVTAAGVVTDLSGRDTLLSGKAGVVVKLNDHGNVYASFGSSATPPGSANFQLNASPSNQNNPNVDPQESTNYEAGTKWDLAGNRLQLSGAYFWTENRNVIFVVDAAAVPPIFNQDDEQRVSGVALSVVGSITPRLDVNMSLQYLDSESRSQNPLTDGRRLLLTPDLSGSLWATYAIGRGVRAGGGVRYTDRVYVNAANTITVPSYAVGDALLEAPVGRHLTLRMNVYNLTDRVYVRNVNNNAGRYNRGTPRSILLTSAIRF